ncbi:site-specific integrase [Lichenihabitans psoromatis]|uniref:site-specific integrase n=1 Tax=Lichenihabitans psoromatis TaxID=2528642 RepID=UPI0010361223|nr:site-specific integrase [Lichenihabitans psoromatis]
MSNLPVPIGGRDVAHSTAFTEAVRSAVDYALAEKSPATRRAYASDFRQFTAWCTEVGADPLPASIATVAGYLASLADGGIKASTINRRAAAIAYHHVQARHEPPTSAEAIKQLMRGIRRTIGTRVTQKAPATDKVMKAINKVIPDTLIGKRDRALLGVGFAAALRRSEIVALDVNDLERVLEGVIVHIRTSKTDQEGSGHVVAVPRGSKLGAVAALEAWLAAAAIIDGPVFRSIAKGGHVSPLALSDRSVADIIKRWVAVAKFDPTLFSGHSMRAGFATSALASGADPFKVMDVTRHKDVSTLKIYDRRAKAFKDHAGKGFL